MRDRIKPTTASVKAFSLQAAKDNVAKVTNLLRLANIRLEALQND